MTTASGASGAGAAGAPGVLLVDVDEVRRGKTLHALASAGVPCTGAAEVPLTFDGIGALVVDHAGAGIPRVDDNAGPGVPLVLLVDGRWPHDHPDIFQRSVRHVVARSADVDDLAVVLRCLLARRAPSPDEWLAKAQAEERIEIRRAHEKHDAIDRTRSFVASLEIADRLVANACHIVEELLTNAVFNAPVSDDTGEHLHARKKRTEDVALPDGKHVELLLRTDGHRLAMSVRDPWGTLSAGHVHGYLAKGFRRGADQVDAKEGGAGLGLYQVFEGASHLVVVIERRVRTEVTALIEAGGTYRSFALESKSLNVFERTGVEQQPAHSAVRSSG